MKKTILIFTIGMTTLVSCYKDLGNCDCYTVTETNYIEKDNGLITVKLKSLCDSTKIIREFESKSLVVVMKNNNTYCE